MASWRAASPAGAYLPLLAHMALASHAWWSNDTLGSWSSQFGQDFTIARLFDGVQGSRFFVDLAANHAVFLSNTRALERDHGWEGICIEPNPELVQELRAQRHCRVVQHVVGSWREPVSFHVHGRDDGLSRVVARGGAAPTPTVPLASLLADVAACVGQRARTSSFATALLYVLSIAVAFTLL